MLYHHNASPNAPFPSQPYPPAPVVCLPPEYTGQFFSLLSDLQSQVQETACLRFQLLQKKNAEEAFGKIWEMSDRLYTSGRNGTPLEILDHAVQSALHIFPEPPLSGSEIYVVQLRGINASISLPQDRFFSDSHLLNALEEAGARVTQRRSVKATATLIRSAIAVRMKSVSLSFYGGWQTAPDGESYHFGTFPKFSTHQAAASLTLSVEATTSASAAVASAAASQFLPSFSIFSDPSVRQTLVLWWHTAALYSLLTQLGFPPPMGLCCFTTAPEQLRCLQSLFAWFGDTPISLNLPAPEFNTALLHRKDQPLLVLDEARLDVAAKNAESLTAAVVTRKAPWKSDKKIHYLPLQSLPTVLSARASALTCLPELIVLDLPPDGFNRDAWMALENRLSDNQDYLTAFLGYTAEHIPALQTALEDGLRQAQHLGADLNNFCTSMLGILLGIGTFLLQFFQFCASAQPPFSVGNDKLTDQLHKLLRQASDKEVTASLPEQFVTVTRLHLRNGFLLPCPTTRYTPESNLFFDADALYLTPKSFYSICRDLFQSTPVVQQALSEAGFLSGKPINSATLQTRVGVWDAYGRYQNLHVFKLDRSAFDHLGDPLIFEGEEDLQ